MNNISNNISNNLISTARVLYSSTFPELIKVSTFAVLFLRKRKPYGANSNH